MFGDCRGKQPDRAGDFLHGRRVHDPAARLYQENAEGAASGYRLSAETEEGGGRPGNFVKKAMSACTGREIMTEILGHLHIEAEASKILETSICIPCMMPFITSQFLPRIKGDRPQIIPNGSKNLAFIGQFCEQADDVVFTVEYSIRSAQTAVYALLGLKREPPAIYKGKYDPRVLYKAFMALHDLRSGGRAA